LHKKKKQVKDKGFLMSKYPHDPIIRGSFFKINKEYAKLRKYKKKQFRLFIACNLRNSLNTPAIF
jgi:hypothetical protein